MPSNNAAPYGTPIDLRRRNALRTDGRARREIICNSTLIGGPCWRRVFTTQQENHHGYTIVPVDRLATVAIVACALIGTGMTIYRGMQPAQHSIVRPARPSHRPRSRIGSCYQEGGHRRGPANAPVTIVEFMDYECPFCARMADTLRIFQERHPTTVSIVFRQFPLEDIHPFARAAALASECADQQVALMHTRCAISCVGDT